MRLLFKQGKQKEIIKEEKENLNISWKQLADKLGIKQGKLMSYVNEESLLPEEIFDKLALKEKFRKYILEKKSENWGTIKGGTISKGNTKEIIIPEDSKELAEFYGIMLGDGNSTKIKGYKIGTYMIRIVGDSRYDKEYLLNYVKHIIEKLFSIEVKFGYFKDSNAIFIEAHSRKLIEFLELKGFKSGNKIKNQLRIPDWIRNNGNYLKLCIRGLFDTDGSYYRLTNQNTHQINFKNHNSGLLKDFRNGLLSLGINCSKISKGNSVYVTKKEEIGKFFKLIGTKNSRHLNRIKMF